MSGKSTALTLRRRTPEFRFGEPWSLGHKGGSLVSPFPTHHTDAEDSAPRHRAYYGGNLVAESMRRDFALRAAACVNFCAGFEFPDRPVAPGFVADLIDLMEQAYRRLAVPKISGSRCEAEREHFQFWYTIREFLEAVGRPQPWPGAATEDDVPDYEIVDDDGTLSPISF